MNISINYRNLEQYSINDYYNKDKHNFLPYLWTSAYGLQALIKEKKPHSLIKKYISQVHSILGTFDNTNLAIIMKPKLKWFQNLSHEKRELLNKSFKGLKNTILTFFIYEIF